MTTPGRWLGGMWRGLGSTWLAASLLAALLLATLIASLFPQKPPDPVVQQAWLLAAGSRFGSASELLHALGLFDVYHSAWYRGLLAALLLNTLVCTIRRLPRLWRSLIQAPRIVRPDTFYQGFALRAEWPVPSLEQGVASAQQWLRSQRYQVHVESPPLASCAYLFAERGHWAPLGTLLAHVSAFALAAAIAVRPALLWLEPSVDLLPGQLYTVERTEPITVRAGELTVERHPDGQPRKYLAPLALVQGGRPTVTQTVRIGQPLTHRQVNFHLQAYGPGLRLVTPDGTFHLALGGSQAQELSVPQVGLRLRIAVRPGGDGLFVEILTANGAILGSGTVADGQEIAVRGLPILFDLSPYTTWQVSYDPTFLPAVGAAIILLTGTVLSLWVPHRRLWLRIDAECAEVVATGDFGGSPDSSFEALASESARLSLAAAEASRNAAGSALSGQDEESDA